METKLAQLDLKRIKAKTLTIKSQLFKYLRIIDKVEDQMKSHQNKWQIKDFTMKYNEHKTHF